MSWFVALILLFLCYLSVRRRLWIKRIRVRKESVGAPEVQPASSPLADSLKELVGLAGGTYIAISALAAFLKISIPAQATVLGVQMDPAAAICVLIAVIQPYFHSTKSR